MAIRRRAVPVGSAAVTVGAGGERNQIGGVHAALLPRRIGRGSIVAAVGIVLGYVGWAGTDHCVGVLWMGLVRIGI